MMYSLSSTFWSTPNLHHPCQFPHENLKSHSLGNKEDLLSMCPSLTILFNEYDTSKIYNVTVVCSWW